MLHTVFYTSLIFGFSLAMAQKGPKHVGYELLTGALCRTYTICVIWLIMRFWCGGVCNVGCHVADSGERLHCILVCIVANGVRLNCKMCCTVAGVMVNVV